MIALDLGLARDLRTLACALEGLGQHENASRARRLARHELDRIEGDLIGRWTHLESFGDDEAAKVQRQIEQVLRDLADLWPDLAPGDDP